MLSQKTIQPYIRLNLKELLKELKERYDMRQIVVILDQINIYYFVLRQYW